MTRVNLPPGCYGFSSDGGTTKIIAERGPGSYVNVDDDQLRRIKKNEYASAGLVDAGPEKFFVRKGTEGAWCGKCPKMYYKWHKECPKGHGPTIPESELQLPELEEYIP